MDAYNYNESVIIGVSFTNDSGTCFIKGEDVVNYRELFENDTPKSTYDVKKCYILLNKLGIKLNNCNYDAMIASYLLDYKMNDDITTLMNDLKVEIKSFEDTYGTLKRRKKVELEETIKQCIDKDINIVIASGRPIDSIKNIANEIGANKYFIASNGALIYDMEKEQTIYEKYLSKDKILEIIENDKDNFTLLEFLETTFSRATSPVPSTESPAKPSSLIVISSAPIVALPVPVTFVTTADAPLNFSSPRVLLLITVFSPVPPET